MKISWLFSVLWFFLANFGNHISNVTAQQRLIVKFTSKTMTSTTGKPVWSLKSTKSMTPLPRRQSAQRVTKSAAGSLLKKANKSKTAKPRKHSAETNGCQTPLIDSSRLCSSGAVPDYSLLHEAVQPCQKEVGVAGQDVAASIIKRMDIKEQLSDDDSDIKKLVSLPIILEGVPCLEVASGEQDWRKNFRAATDLCKKLAECAYPFMGMSSLDQSTCLPHPLQFVRCVRGYLMTFCGKAIDGITVTKPIIAVSTTSVKETEIVSASSIPVLESTIKPTIEDKTLETKTILTIISTTKVETITTKPTTIKEGEEELVEEEIEPTVQKPIQTTIATTTDATAKPIQTISATTTDANAKPVQTISATTKKGKAATHSEDDEDGPDGPDGPVGPEEGAGGPADDMGDPQDEDPAA